jgi:hypothetical protein
MSISDQDFPFSVTMYDAGLIYLALRQLARNALTYHHDLHAFVKEIMDTILVWDEKFSGSAMYFFYKTGSDFPWFEMTHECRTMYLEYLTAPITAVLPFRLWQIIHCALRTAAKEKFEFPTHYALPDRDGKKVYKRVPPKMHLEYHDLVAGRLNSLIGMLYNADDERIREEEVIVP